LTCRSGIFWLFDDATVLLLNFNVDGTLRDRALANPSTWTGIGAGVIWRYRTPCSSVSIEPNGHDAAKSDLGALLCKLRKVAGLSGERLAVRCAMSQSKVSRIERGKQLPTVDDVERILKALEVPAEAAEEIIVLARRANVEHVSVRALAEVGLWRKQADLKALTETCTVQRSFLPIMVSGLLQTPEYARAALSPTIPSSPARDVDKAVAARLDRQTVLDDPSRQFCFLMTEHWAGDGAPR